ncbi:MAG: PAS domain S-box protein [Armatimonadetes bacterium]|nr:PAS domain S-box protein [Armatimonadota bacterium]
MNTNLDQPSFSFEAIRETIFRQSRTVVIVAEPWPPYRVIYVPPNASDVLKYSHGEVFGRGLPDCPFGEAADPATVRELIEETLRNGIATAEYEYFNGEGESRWLAIESHLVEDENGRAQYLAFVAHDTTEHVLIRQEAQRAQRLYTEVVETAVEAFVTIDSRGKIASINAAAQKMFGFDSEQLVGEDVSILMPEEVGRDHQKYLEHAQPGVESYVIGKSREVEGKRSDGTAFPIEITISEIQVDGERMFNGICRDITRRRMAEQALRGKTKEAQQANEAKSKFLSRMSHELRTPLNAILGFAQVLEMSDLDGEDLESVRHILKGGHHLLELINDILDISRIEAGKLAATIKPVQLVQCINDSLELIAPLANERFLIVTPPKDLSEDLYVLADRQRLGQVFLNVLSNAVKYNKPNGSVTITVDTSNECLVAVVIQDTGIGIPESKLQDLFVPFERLGAESTRVEGSGLGLALTNGLMAEMSGHVDISSTEGAGTTVSLLLPRAMRSDDAAQTIDNGVARQPSTSTPLDILLIEDNIPSINLVERAFEAQPNWTLRSAHTGAEGLAAARERTPDVILLDVNLPDVTGPELIRSFRLDPELEEVPVIIVSADASHATQDTFLSAGAQTYLSKPFDIQRLFAQIRDLTFSSNKV